MKVSEDFHAGKLLVFLPGKFEGRLDETINFERPAIEGDFGCSMSVEYGPFASPRLTGRDSIPPLCVGTHDDIFREPVGKLWFFGLIFVEILVHGDFAGMKKLVRIEGRSSM